MNVGKKVAIKQKEGKTAEDRATCKIFEFRQNLVAFSYFSLRIVTFVRILISLYFKFRILILNLYKIPL